LVWREIEPVLPRDRRRPANGSKISHDLRSVKYGLWGRSGIRPQWRVQGGWECGYPGTKNQAPKFRSRTPTRDEDEHVQDDENEEFTPYVP
jgi:hypothetical protein